MLALAGLVALAAALVWIERRPLAQRFVDRELARRGVPARYVIEDVGLSTQRLSNLVIGDPAHPDLVADWVEVKTAVGLSGPSVTGIAVGRVRLRARLVDGRVSLGALDRLMPPPSGKPFELPGIDARLGDVGIRLETPYGPVGLKLTGDGRLDDGFKGRLALVADTLDLGGCTLARPAAALALRVVEARPSIEGPVRVAGLRCGTVRGENLMADGAVTLGAALDRWNGRARIASGRVAVPGVAAAQLLGTVSFAGNARATAGAIDVAVAQLASGYGNVRATTIEGRYRVGTAGLAFNGGARGDRAALAPATLRQVAALAGSAGGTPVGPIVRRVAGAAVAAGRGFGFDAAIEAVAKDGAQAVRIARATLTAASGASVSIAGSPIRFGAVAVGGEIGFGGGGLPEGRFALARGADGLDGTGRIAPYAADGAMLALGPIRVRGLGGRALRVISAARIDGPLADGRVTGLTLPLDARWAGGRFAVNPGCGVVGWSALRVSSLSLTAARLGLCPVDGAWFALDGGRPAGGVRIAATTLAGQLGTSPLRLAVTGAQLRLGNSGLSVTGLDARLGPAARESRLAVARLDGRFAGGAMAGSFGGAAGRIGAVPLLLSDAAGSWRLAGGRLALAGALTVADSAVEPRFKPLAAREVTLTLADGMIDAKGVLRAPKGDVRIADVAITHRLSDGSGSALLDVPGIAFKPGGLQPDDLTPVTYGVIAEVAGSVSGQGRIAWDGQGVRSAGSFRTAGTDLAAAFGPVTGLSAEIVFTDLLGLVSAPAQTATIATINPGIAVENGTVTYQLTGNNRVAVAGGRWPFAGGELTLDPTTLDFNADQQRRMTFNVKGVNAAAFLQQFDFDNLNATGTFDGVLPMVFDQRGGRIEGGRLQARGGGSIAYIGTVTERDVGFWGNLAFQALKALDYRSLGITLNGPLAGEMVTEIRFAGISQGKGTKSNFLIRRLAKLPFVFNVTVRAPFRQLVDSVRSYYDPSRLIQRNLPALLEQQKRRDEPLPAPPPAIQPPESEKRP